MSTLKIVIGNKSYSSWSLRPWLVLEHLGIPYEEQLIPLDYPETRDQIAKVTPAGRVPVLIDGDLTVWDSLAICEYLAERHPDRDLWPKDRAARARARSVSAEMHSGFATMRNQLPMKFKESVPHTLSDDARADVARIQALWTECRAQYGRSGPFLFGAFTIADAMFAPVVSRFRTYGVPVEGPVKAYTEAMWGHPGMQKWLEGAKAETYRMARYDKR